MYLQEIEKYKLYSNSISRWLYQSLLVLQLRLLSPHYLNVLIIRQPHLNFRIESLGRSKLLNNLANHLGLPSGSGCTIIKTMMCHLSVTGLARKKIKWNKGESTFVSRGYSNWKDAVIAFKKHKGSDFHKSALEVIVTLPLQCRDIVEQLSK